MTYADTASRDAHPDTAMILRLTTENKALTAEIERLNNVNQELHSENARLREGLREVFEQWAGSEGFIPETAPEGYLLQLIKRMAFTASAALAGKAEQ